MRFSKHGTLLKSCEALISESSAGYGASDLESLLHVSVKDPLRKLAGEGRVVREESPGGVLYVSAEGRARRRQLAGRSRIR